MRYILALGAAAASLAACAPVEGGGVSTAADAGLCFEAAQVSNFRTENDRQVYIRSQRGDVFRLDTTAPNCFDAATRSLAIEPYGGSRARMCPGDQVRVRVIDGSPTPKTCIARLSERITVSDASGLPGRR